MASMSMNFDSCCALTEGGLSRVLVILGWSPERDPAALLTHSLHRALQGRLEGFNLCTRWINNAKKRRNSTPDRIGVKELVGTSLLPIVGRGGLLGGREHVCRCRGPCRRPGIGWHAAHGPGVSPGGKYGGTQDTPKEACIYRISPPEVSLNFRQSNLAGSMDCTLWLERFPTACETTRLVSPLNGLVP